MMSLDRRILTVERERQLQKFENASREFQERSEDDLAFFAIHGYFPELARVSEPIVKTFTTRGLKTTIRLERDEG
jgi:hypothetical protein